VQEAGSDLDQGDLAVVAFHLDNIDGPEQHHLRVGCRGIIAAGRISGPVQVLVDVARDEDLSQRPLVVLPKQIDPAGDRIDRQIVARWWRSRGLRHGEC